MIYNIQYPIRYNVSSNIIGICLPIISALKRLVGVVCPFTKETQCGSISIEIQFTLFLTNKIVNGFNNKIFNGSKTPWLTLPLWLHYQTLKKSSCFPPTKWLVMMMTDNAEWRWLIERWQFSISVINSDNTNAHKLLDS